MSEMYPLMTEISSLLGKRGRPFHEEYIEHRTEKGGWKEFSQSAERIYDEISSTHRLVGELIDMYMEYGKLVYNKNKGEKKMLKSRGRYYRNLRRSYKANDEYSDADYQALSKDFRKK